LELTYGTSIHHLIAQEDVFAFGRNLSEP
jgi:hypothetical protein